MINVLLVRCPECCAKPGVACTNLTTNAWPTKYPHPARRRAALRALKEETAR